MKSILSDNKDEHEQNIRSLIGLEETISLEFKSAQALDKSNDHNKEIWKDVSSFANGGEGVIIYGINEMDHKADSFSFIDGNIVAKEWLEQMIHSNIHRRIDGLKIDPVRFDDKIEQTVYVIQIPESSNAPHMGKDNKYYKRYNFMAVAMEEYEVRTLYSRLTKTELIIDDIEVSRGGSGLIRRHNVFDEMAYADFRLNCQLTNTSSRIEDKLKLILKIPNAVIHPDLNAHLQKYFVRNISWWSEYSIMNSTSAFQGETASIVSFTIHVEKGNIQHMKEVPLKLKLYYTNGVVERDFNLYQLVEIEKLNLVFA